MKKEDLIKMGFVVNPHGIRGESEVRLFNAENSILEDGMTVTIYPASAKSRISPEGEKWKISKIRFGNKVICQFEGIRDRTHLETLIPFEIFLDREVFPEPEEDEVYLVDLIDMDVVNDEGLLIGKVESFSDNGVQYLLDVRVGQTGEIITLPFVDSFFPRIDREKRQITIILPEYTE